MRLSVDRAFLSLTLWILTETNHIPRDVINYEKQINKCYHVKNIEALTFFIISYIIILSKA